jgi:zinc transport system substrate-binding protein
VKLRLLLIAPLLALAVLPACRRPSEPKLKVVASTTLIAAIAEEVGSGRVQVTTVAPAGLCPGHFEIPPSAVVAANEARLLLNHGWEQWFPRLTAAITNPRLVQMTARTQGNWMVPPVHRTAVEELTGILEQLDPARATAYESDAGAYLARVESTAVHVRRLFEGRALPRVIAADKQAPFLRWLGFSVAATYGRPEDLTARELSRLARVAVDSGVGLVVDNLQSGPDAGQPLAQAYGCPQVTLTNFPLHGSYPRALLDNAAALLRAVEPHPDSASLSR